MNRPRSFIAFAILLAACSAPEGAHTAKDVPDEAPPAKPMAETKAPVDANVYAMPVDELPAVGAASAPLTVVLFSDYECPFCRKLDATLVDLRAEYKDEMRIVFAPRPLAFHQQARPAALAALAGAMQGRLEAMHERLIALDGHLDDASLTEAARGAGLDLARFEIDRKSAAAEKILARTEALAKRFSVQGTPTVFVNGRRMTGAMPGVLRELAAEQLSAGRALAKSSPRRVYEAIVAKGLDHADPDPAVTTFKYDHPKLTTEQIDQMRRCATQETLVELTVQAGAVTGVHADTPAITDCITKTTAAWTVEGCGEAKTLKFAVKPEGAP